VVVVVGFGDVGGVCELMVVVVAVVAHGGGAGGKWSGRTNLGFIRTEQRRRSANRRNSNRCSENLNNKRRRLPISLAGSGTENQR
jgi:hypothetical protein